MNNEEKKGVGQSKRTRTMIASLFHSMKFFFVPACLGVLSFSIVFVIVLKLPIHQTSLVTDFSEYNKIDWVAQNQISSLKFLFLVVASFSMFVFSLFIARPIGLPWVRNAVVMLRSACIAFVCILFIEPAIRLRRVDSPPNTVAILVDASLSMTKPANSQESLYQKALNIIHRSENFIESLLEKHHLAFYTFGEKLTKVQTSSFQEHFAVQNTSELLSSIKELADHHTAGSVAGIVVLSDDVLSHTEEFYESDIWKNQIANYKFPIHTIKVNSAPLTDIAIDKIDSGEFAFVRTVSRLDVTIKTSGLDQEVVLPLELFENGTLIRQKNITLSPKSPTTSRFFEVTPPHHGTFLYKVKIGSIEGEKTLENNSKTIVIKAIRDKIRILHVAGRPSWDVRSLRGMLKQNSNVDLVSFFILRTQDDLQLANENELSLIPFPTRELFEKELQSFDVVILQNFEFLPYGMFKYLENIRDYVAKGGGLIMVGGPLTYYDGQYQNTALQEALPVELPVSGDLATGWLTHDFKAELHVDGATHPITAFLQDDHLATTLDIPMLSGLNLTAGLKQDSLELLSVTSSSDAKKHPLVVVGKYREGRSLAVMTHSLWRWDLKSMEEDTSETRDYFEFWDRSIRWLIGDPSLGSLQVQCSKQRYNLEEKPQIKIVDRQFKNQVNEATVDVLLQSIDSPKNIQLKLGLDGQGQKTHDFPLLNRGHYKVVVKSSEEETECLFSVGTKGDEFRITTGKTSLLEDISKASSGIHLVDIDTFPHQLEFKKSSQERVTAVKNIETWNKPFIFFGVFCCLLLDWLLRFKSGTL